MFRKSLQGAALVLGLLLTLGIGGSTVWACEGAECQTGGKSLDLKEFLREQAASTRTPDALKQTQGGASRHKHSARSSVSHRKLAKTPHSERRAVAARSLPKPAPQTATNDDASANAPQPLARSDVQVVSADQLNDIDRAAAPQATETMGKASDTTQDAQNGAPDVQVVVANDFNEIDRRAAEQMQPAAAAASASEAPQPNGSTKSWMQWLWSAIGAGFIAIAGLARYLTA